MPILCLCPFSHFSFHSNCIDQMLSEFLFRLWRSLPFHMSRGFLKINATNHVKKERKNKILSISLINFQWLRKRIQIHS